MNPRTFNEALVYRCPKRWRSQLAQLLCRWGFHTWWAAKITIVPMVADYGSKLTISVKCSRCGTHWGN